MIRENEDESEIESDEDSYLQMILEDLRFPFESDAEYATVYGVRRVEDKINEGVDLVDRDYLETALLTACMVGEAEDDKSDFAVVMLNYAFNSTNYKKTLESLYENKQKKKGPCRRVIEGPTGYGYRCLDCQRNASSVICQSCFDHSNHEGHR